MARGTNSKSACTDEEEGIDDETNVADAERWASAFGGAALAANGLRQRSFAGVMIVANGGALMFRGGGMTA
jgi:uncharacterized membrane protein